MLSHSTSVTIVGFGAFGRMIAAHLALHCAVSVYDRGLPPGQTPAQVRFLTGPQEICGDIVILAVPVQAVAECLREIAPHLRAGQMVVDVCSIKEEPARLMQAMLPEGVEILATHPMFGPASGRMGVAGLQIVLCPLQGKGWRRLAVFLRRGLKLDVIVTTPEEHDRQAAMSQGLIHLLAHAVQTWGERPTIRTKSYDLFAEALAMVRDDAPEVFEAITQRNSHVATLREHLLQTMGPRPLAPLE
ncbi:prephenate dehydrogenase/arogenate dehydrogenase family protein [Pseudooceanicola spongiae]|uniref:Prephenate dehydrogenase/arogenate dehydrogenase family protein n=1 Tax=Pseudooceanicola spongiae TaxID=2613965 RepID=A0A7L9WLP8_9RHOB|nr:prephenate dehydrogenase/arogenate dehydrogenase family protein [Pseudooceanicola spongiae]QOL80853.1 prephenate dehydrogenase/arogenate dehydrogenase family protein [Pseudooceanicola spongiae]